MTDDIRKQLKEIVDGLTGVTPGPWIGTVAISSTMGAPVVSQTGIVICNIAPVPCGFPGKDEIDRYQLANIAHIARCDPDTFRGIATLVAELDDRTEHLQRLLSLEKDAHVKSNEEAIAEIKRLREQLQEAVRISKQYSSEIVNLRRQLGIR